MKCVGWCVCMAVTDKAWQMARELAIEHRCASLTMMLMRVHSHHCEKCKHRKHSQVSSCWQGGEPTCCHSTGMHGSWSKERRSICAPAHSPRVVYFDLCSVNASFRKFLQQKSREQPGDRLRKRARSRGHAPAALGLTSDVKV